MNFINVLDPDIVDLVGSYFVVAGKYAIFFGLTYLIVRMVVRAVTGKERFL